MDVEQVALRRLRTWAAGLGDELGGAWQGLHDRLGLDRGYFSHPLALPVLALPMWAFDSNPAVAARGEEALLDAIEAAASGYLHVRIQDDLLDEGIGGTADQHMLAEALLARHQRLVMGLAGGDAAFGELFEARWTGYAEAMAAEAALGGFSAPVDAPTYDKLLRRSGPMVLPPAALCAGAWPQALAPLDGIVAALARSHQLFTDVVDIEKDLHNDQPGHLLTRFGADQGLDHLRRRLYLDGGLDQVVGEARDALDQAQAMAVALGLIGLDDWIERRKATMERVRQEVFAAMFAQLFT